MDQPNATNRDSKRKACDTCKRRKVRCTGENPCPNCIRQGIRCQYSLSHGRLAHSERRAANLRERMDTIETVWKRFVPQIELSEAMRTVQSEREDSQRVGGVSSPFPHGHDLEPIVLEKPFLETVNNDYDESDSKQATPYELEHGDADALNWDESNDIVTSSDGIGSLSTGSKGIGYMGPQSGNALLRNLQTSSMVFFSPFDEMTTNQSPAATIPDHVLASSSFMSHCIDWYFQHYHTAYPILHEGCFRAQLMGALPKPKDGSWPVLLNTVLAIGAHSGPMCDQHPDIYFYQQVLRSLTWSLLQRGTLSIVQALALLANYLQKRSLPNSGFTLLGAAMNMAQGIGLHRELSVPATTAFTMEIRRRVWWTLFIFDSGARVTFGRPTLTLGGITTRLPRNLADEDLSVDIEELPHAQNMPTVTSSLIWQSKLAKIGNLANEALLGQRLPDPKVMLGLGERVRLWNQSLPAYMRADFDDHEFEKFKAPHMILLWRSMHLRIVMFRPFVLDIVKNRRALDMSDISMPASQCFAAAEECVLSILNFWNSTSSHHGSLVWYGCYWLVTAVFVHVTCLLYEPQNALALVWRQHIEASREVFESMGAHEHTALKAARIIDKIMGLVPSSPDSTFFAVNENVRMEAAEFWNLSWVDLVMPQTSSSNGLQEADLNP